MQVYSTSSHISIVVNISLKLAVFLWNMLTVDVGSKKTVDEDSDWFPKGVFISRETKVKWVYLTCSNYCYCLFQVVMMVIVLLSPALLTPDMDRLSSTHLVTTLMGVIKGYKRSFSLSVCFIKTIFSLFLKYLFIWFCWRTVTNRTISGEPARDPEEYWEAALKQCDPEMAFNHDCDWIICTTLKI